MGEGVSKCVVLIIMYDHLGKLSATIWRSTPPMAGGFSGKHMEMVCRILTREYSRDKLLWKGKGERRLDRERM